VRLALALLLIAAVARADVAQAPSPTLAALSERLPNGLTLVVHEDTSVSSVAIVLRYDLGPDDASHAGYAHLTEKLAAQGTVHTKPGEFDRRIDEAGGFTTSTTDADGIRFTTHVPAGALEVALFLEAERMAGLADGLSDAGLATARDQIDAEYRAAYVDEPYALIEREVAHALWGTTRDFVVDRDTLAQATRTNVRTYIRERLVPMNATLAIAGHVDAAQALALARKYFAWIPPGSRVARPSTPVDRLAAPIAKTASDPNGRHVVAYRINTRGADDEIAVEVAARLIAESLAKNAVSDSNSAGASDSRSDTTGVRYEITHSTAGGELRFVSSSRLTAADIEQAIAPPLMDEAVRRAVNELSLDTLLALEGLAYRTDALALGADFERRLAVLKTITADTVKRAATYWLAKSAAVTVIGVNAGGAP
jgi:predicted Zn-dependent peptidase